MKRKAAFLAVASAMLVVGCGGGEDTAVTTTPVVTPPAIPEFKPDVDAGVPPVVVSDPALISRLAAQKVFVGRPDPFALLSNERAFEASQEAERFVDTLGGWTLAVEPPPPPTGLEDEQRLEPQPYRRLSGIIVGDTVQAIIELEGGRVEIIRPGMRIPNSEWRVISIDQDKAILRRAGNRRPNQIEVRLETPPAGMQQGGQPGMGGPPGRGGPGGPPGSFGPPGSGGGGAPDPGR